MKQITIVAKEYDGLTADIATVLGEHGINIDMISTSEIKISVVVEGGKGEEATRALHAVFFGEEK